MDTTEASSSRPRVTPTVLPAAMIMQQETHPWLKWPGCDKDQKIVLNNRLADIQHRSICQPRFIDVSLCDQLNVTNPLKEMFRTRNETRWEELELPMWQRALNVKEQIYREWCLEFYSSLTVEKKKFLPHEFVTAKIIRFRLGGKEHQVSVIEFGVLAGIIPPESAEREHIGSFIFKGVRDSKEFDAHEAWKGLTGIPKHTGTSKASAIRYPILRLVHKLLTHSFIQRSTQKDKVYLDDLWILHTFHQGRPGTYVCVPWVLVCFMEAKGAGRQKDSQICCGHFITRIAKNLKLMTQANISKCSAPVDFRYITIQELETSKLVNATRTALVDEVGADTDAGEDSDEEAGGGDEVPGTSGKMSRVTQRQLLNEMKNMTTMMEDMGRGMNRIECKVDCAVANYSYHTERYQPYWESMAAAHASASGAEWPMYAPPPPYAPEDQEE